MNNKNILSIIIPYYNAEPYMAELIEALNPQITEGVEVIIIDDGSVEPYQATHEWAKVYRQKNKGLAGARNAGLKRATGEIIAFIDADDLVASNYIKTILSRADEPWDYMELSWRSLEDKRFMYKLKNDQDKLSNPSACTRVFKREFIGKTRFNEKKDVAEDEDFTRRLDLEKAQHICATDYLYYYRTETPNSLSKKYREGKTKTKRIVYYLPIITVNDFILLEEVERESQQNEVVILTNKNELPELEKFAQIYRPQQTWAHEARGVKNNYIKIRREPMKTQVAIYTKNTFKIGGIETFIYNFCKTMSKHYDIAVIYEQADPEQLARLQPIVPIIKADSGQEIECDTLIINRVFDNIPKNIKAKQVIQMVHGCQDVNPHRLPKEKGQLVCVSETVKKSFGEEAADAQVIKNLVDTGKTQDALLLVSATRLDTPEKGQQRMIALANLMHKQGVPFIWLYFANERLKNAPAGLIKMEPTMDIRPILRRADYTVQLSDSEAFCYTIAESLLEATPVITTPLPVLKELGVKDGENAYVIPFELEGYDTRKLLDIPKVNYTYNNGLIVSKWKKLLGNTKPTGSYKPDKIKFVEVVKEYKDIQLGRIVKPGEAITMEQERAERAQAAGFVVIKGE